jgi:phytoene desaturase
MSKIAVIGAGFAGLTSAISLAAKGHDVSLYEKNETIGGRARQFSAQGFTFDMGPSWYWMPDVFENFYQKYGFTQSDFYDLKRLDPSYRVYFEDEHVDIPATYEELEALFEQIEPGSGKKLAQFLKEAKYKYETGMNDLVFKPGKSLFEFMDLRVIKGAFSLHLFSSISEHIRKYFSHPKLIQILEFPVLFLGAMPKNTPALYSLMNYADIKLGTWYPMGGMFEIIKAFEKIATSFGVEINTNQAIDGFAIKSNRITGISTTKGDVQVDGIVASADYNHIEQEILKPEHRQYSPAYWDTRKMSPSSILFYLGVNKPIPELQHHNLFFDTSFDAHAKAIYEDPAWPEKPLFYVCNPSKTDPGVAPKGEENLFILVPVASGLADNEEIIEEYYQMIMGRLEKRLKMNIADSVVYKKSYALSDFKKDYHAFKGNAYGLANTLRQTAVLKPSMHNKKVRNLIYSGQLTVPGPGVPPSIISGQVAADELIKTL